MPVVSLTRPPYGAQVIKWGVVPAHNWYRRDGAVPFVYWPSLHTPALGLAGLTVLSLLPGEALGVYRTGLCWLAL